jgi:DNA polymerase III epsilon subunit-like protein
MKRELHYMIDIETTGVERGKDKILQVGAVEIELRSGFWYPTGREFERTLHYAGQPENEFAKKHMSALYAKCNAMHPAAANYEVVGKELRRFIHTEGSQYLSDFPEPKFFIGWNASNFDMPFLFDAGMLTPSYYKAFDGKERLCGDAHYRIYEQTGSVQLISDMTGLDRKTIETLAMDLNPTNTELPKGKEHDALYDCYKQIILQNGLIKIGRMGIMK